MATLDEIKSWHIPLSRGDLQMSEAKSSLASLGAEPGDIPLVVQLVENPRFDIPGIEIFNGATDLSTHDYIHLLLGRGLMPMDEAFVIGFTMGSTNRVSSSEERLYTFFAKHVYPKPYRFGEQAIRIFRDAVRLGFVSRCERLDQVDYSRYDGMSLGEARTQIGIEEDLLRAYYAIEKAHFPDRREAARLLD